MGNVKTFFFDTYAFCEIIMGNKNYAAYTKEIIIVTTKLNLMELHYALLLKFGKEKADKYYDKLIKHTVEVSDEVIKESNALKAVWKKRKLSYVDCIGYVIARMMNIRFLTGDKEFRDLENVEYVT